MNDENNGQYSAPAQGRMGTMQQRPRSGGLQPLSAQGQSGLGRFGAQFSPYRPQPYSPQRFMPQTLGPARQFESRSSISGGAPGGASAGGGYSGGGAAGGAGGTVGSGDTGFSPAIGQFAGNAVSALTGIPGLGIMGGLASGYSNAMSPTNAGGYNATNGSDAMSDAGLTPGFGAGDAALSPAMGGPTNVSGVGMGSIGLGSGDSSGLSAGGGEGGGK